jgi:hyperosmotically inducible protein
MKNLHRTLFTASLLVVAVLAASHRAVGQEPKAQQDLIREVRHQLVLLPYYSVFDNLAFQVKGSEVILSGQVVRPTLKSDAEAVVKKIDGVTKVVNNIEVLPLSPNDDQIRRAVFRAIYSEPALSRYAQSAVPSIHIIVKNGNVTLEGVADSETDKNLAGLRANGVPGVFSVKNNLVVAGG